MQGIDRVVQRVKAMYEPLEVVTFNIFDYGKDKTLISHFCRFHFTLLSLSFHRSSDSGLPLIPQATPLSGRQSKHPFTPTMRTSRMQLGS